MKKKIIASIMALTMAVLPTYPARASEGDDKQEENITYENSYVDIGIRTEYYVPASDLPVVHSVALPVAYDSRDYNLITSVKDQNPYGTCWAFAAMAAGESSMLAQGYVDSPENIDLSEYHFAYFFYNYVNDPLGNLKDDKANAVCDSYLSVGGNNYYSMFALATWRGAADESKAPYEDLTYETTLSDDIAFDDVAHMQNAYHVSMQNKEDVKKLIMEYGALATSMNMEQSYYYNFLTEAYYRPLETYENSAVASNHAVTIIGWDDNYPVENFLEGYRPAEPGAWIIKNSWADYCDYFYVSYEDVCVANEDAFAFVFEPADNYDKNYQYDGAYNVNTMSAYSGDSFANVYTCEGESKEKIDAVSIAIADANLNYSIQIYKNPDASDPREGTPMLDTPQTGSTTYPGYYTVELDEDIYIEPGDRFAVVFTLSNIDTSKLNVTVYMDGDMPGDCISFESYTEDNQSYVINGRSNYITDLYDSYGEEEDYCVRIKAFTSIVDDSGEDVTPDDGEDVTPDDGEDVTPDDGEDVTPDDGEDVTPDDGGDVTPDDGEDVTPDDGGEDVTPDDEKDQVAPESGWFLQGGNWYYFNEKGVLATGWQQIGGEWYYMNSSGVMQTGWQEINGTWYYMNSSGAMETGWQEINGSWYYLYDDGSMAESTWIGNYYVDASGVWENGSSNSSTTYTEGWKLSGGLWWYQEKDGSYPTSTWKSIGNAWYYFDSLGWMATGWINDGNGWYYMNPSGVMATGWLSDQGTWYYLLGSGLMATGWVNDGGTWYYMNSSGAMVTGWLNDNGTWYYLCGSGAMAINTIIDGYVIDGNGTWVQ